MAKAPPTGDPTKLRFRCTQCGTILRVPIKMAGRYIDCPKCKNRTHVPENQKKADEEATDYDVNRLAYDTTGKCRNCGQRMSEKAVVCVKCGFDYRAGKVIDLIDKTKLPADFPTWERILKSFGCPDVVQGMVRIAGAGVLSNVAIFLLGGGVTALLLWLFYDELQGPPFWPWFVFLGIAGLSTLIYFGMLMEALVETCSRALYGRAISVGALPVAAIYFLGIAVPAYFLSAAVLFVLVLSAPPAKEKPPQEFDPGIFKDAPAPELVVNPETGVLGMILTGVFTVVGFVYFFFGVASYAADLSINPINIFKWISRGIAEIPLLVGIGILILALSVAVPAGIMYLVTLFEALAVAIFVLAGLAFLLLQSYFLASMAYASGLVVKRHL